MEYLVNVIPNFQLNYLNLLPISLSSIHNQLQNLVMPLIIKYNSLQYFKY